MTAADKSAFTVPDNPNLQIWRYMDFTKFVSMLQNAGLFFSRSDKLGDPFEGYYPQGTIDAQQATNSLLFERDALPQTPQYLDYINRKRVERCRLYVMVNCWHISDDESPAMWRMYAKSNEAIAIRSTYSTLRKSLPSSVNISMLNYVDEKKFISEFSCVPEERIFIPFVNKRKYFSYEKELRAIFTELSKEERIKVVSNFKAQITTAPSIEGMWQQPIDLNELIEEVRVAPTAPYWFRDLVEKISKNFGLNKTPVQSSLDKTP